MLRQEIRDAVADAEFSIYSVQHIEDVMEILTSLPRGDLNDEGVYSTDSFNYKIQQRVKELQKLQQQYKNAEQKKPQKKRNKSE